MTDLGEKPAVTGEDFEGESSAPANGALSYGSHDELLRLRAQALRQRDAAGEVDKKLTSLLADKTHWRLLQP